MSGFRSAILIGVLAASFPIASAAQASTSLPGPGRYSLSFGIPGGSEARFGIWKVIRPRVNLGLGLGVASHWSSATYLTPPRTGSKQDWSIGLYPEARFYRSTDGPLLPFISVGTGVGYTSWKDAGWSLAGEAEFGFGVEFFPFRAMSISGATGLQGWYSYAEDEDFYSRDLRVSAFQSSVCLNFYF